MPPAPSVRRAVAGKARVHELAKELGVTSKDVLKKLADLGEYVKSASSTVEAPVARKLRDSFPSDVGKPSHANGASTSGRGPSTGIAPAGGGIAAKPGPAPVPARRPEDTPAPAAPRVSPGVFPGASPPVPPQRSTPVEHRIDAQPPTVEQPPAAPNRPAAPLRPAAQRPAAPQRPPADRRPLLRVTDGTR